MKCPKVTCILTVFNGADFIQEAVESILQQTLTDFELVVVDDGSTDGSGGIVSKLQDDRIIFIANKSNQGIAASKNLALKHAKGEYLAMMDADDISMPDRFDKQVGFMESNPEVDVCGTAKASFGRNKRVSSPLGSHTEITTGFLFGNRIVHPSVIIRKSTIDRFKELYDTRLAAAEDYEYWVRLFFRGAVFSNIREPLIKYRVHDANISFLQSNRQHLEAQVVRKSLFKFMGIPTDDDIVDTHDKLCKGTRLDKQSIRLVCDWINLMLYANRKSNAFDEQELKRQLFRKWFSVCRSSSHHGLWVWKFFWNNQVAQHSQLTTYVRFRFFIKCLIKYPVGFRNRWTSFLFIHSGETTSP